MTLLKLLAFSAEIISLGISVSNVICINSKTKGFISVGEDSRFYKRWVNQYPARLSGGSQSPTEINAPRGRRTSGGRSLCADRSEAETAGIRFGIMSAIADPNPAPSLASET